MKIGIIADSHDHLVNINKSIQVFRERGVDFILHLGDFVNPDSVRSFAGTKLVGIFGNNDGDILRLSSAFREINGEIKGNFYEFESDGLRIACYHGTEPQLKNALIECGKYDVVIYGHTHSCVNKLQGNTLVLNPGTAHGFGDNATVMIFETAIKGTEFISL